MSIAELSVKNSVLVNLLMIALFVVGGVSLLSLPRELDPDIAFNWVNIKIIYPGAAPNEVENLIIDPIESEIKDIDDISKIESYASENIGFIMVKFENLSQRDFRDRYIDLKWAVDKAELPDEAEDPEIDDFSSADIFPIININMSYKIPGENALKIADDLEEDLDDISGISKIQVSGMDEREIWVEVDPTKMNALNVRFEEILFALNRRNVNVPGGHISFDKTEYIIRSLGEYRSLKEMEETIIRTSLKGEFIKIKDVAKVSDRRKEPAILSRINGEQCITFSISKKSRANSLDVINEVKALVNRYEKEVPDGITFQLTNDNSIYIKRITNVLRNNAVTGMVLIFFVLYLFLGRVNALLASLGIPISFFITFIFMKLLGFSINGPSLFALIIVLGIIVDDAIIVVENSHRHRLSGVNAHEAAIRGANEVTTPIFTSILTNIAAFLPLIFLPGIIGKFMRIIPTVFSLALIASLFEAFILLPAHYADWTRKARIYKTGEKKFFIVLRKKYQHMLIKVLRRRYLFLIVMLLLLVASVVIAVSLDDEMFGKDDFDQFKVLVKFPEGTSLAENDRIMKKFEKEALALDENDVEAVIANIGILMASDDWVTAKNVSQLLIQLIPQEDRDTSTAQYLKILRERVQHISGPVSLEFEQVSGGPPVGKDISVRVQGKYYDDIKNASLALQDSIRHIKGVHGVTDDYPPGKQEIKITVDEEKAALYGFDTRSVALNVRYAFDGVEATEYRDGDDEIDVIIKYDQANRSSVDDVLNLRLTNPMGKTVALHDIVTFDIRPGSTEIKRYNRKRTVTVTGEIDKSLIALDEINLKMKRLFPELKAKFPDVDFEIGGQFDEFVNIFEDISLLFVMSMLLIFLILGTQFNSYIQPLIILITVPFALIGALLGLLISGNPFSIVALFGIVALAGIVVNDAIVMIDFINKRRQGKKTTVMQYWRSIINSGRLRLRPIILTSLTTISGLIPMAYGFAGTSEMWSPLANVILYGLLVDTIVTLFFIPCLVAIFDDILRSRKKAGATLKH